MSLPHDDLGTAWRAGRPAATLVHLDSAACGRASHAVLAAVSQHARREAETGGYVAESAAAPHLERARAAVGELVGMTGDEVAFVHHAGDALRRLLERWPFAAGATVACVPGEYGPNLAALTARGLRVTDLPVDGLGRVVPEALDGSLRRDRPDLVHLTWIASHRGVVQPAARVAAACRAAGVPVVIDAAQALGHVDTVTTADAVYGTSRKWLAGPRGVGVLAVRAEAAARLRPRPEVGEASCPDAVSLRWLDSNEAHVAGRVGLGVALDEHLAAGRARVHARLAALGGLTRRILDGVGGWQVVEPWDEPSAMTTLEAPDGVDVAAVRAHLLDACGVLTTHAELARAPRELTRPVLRVSPHLDAEPEDLDTLARALADLGRA